MLCFPGFSKKMMVYLIQKHNGNCYEVYHYLIENGWKPCDSYIHVILTNKYAQQFVIPYYHGLKSDVDDLLKNSPNGSYLTYFQFTIRYKYFIAYKNDSGKIIHVRIDSPQINSDLMSKLQLQYPICDSKTRTIKYVPGGDNIYEKFNM